MLLLCILLCDSYVRNRSYLLLSVVSRVFQKLVNNRPVDHLKKCCFSDSQCGFGPS